MRVIASAAVSLDGYIDDCSPRRLVLSGPEDWEEVHRLRATCDAVLVGAETLRRDDPSLRIKDPRLRKWRESAGMPPDLIRATVTRTGNLPSSLRFFEGDVRRIVFTDSSSTDRFPAETVRLSDISARSIAAALEGMGIRRLLVEGGSRTLGMFLSEDAADELRLAIAPFFVGDADAPRLTVPGIYPYGSGRRAPGPQIHAAGDMAVLHYVFHPEPDEADRKLLAEAVELSRCSVPCPTCYRVGCIIVTADGRRYEGYTHETGPAEHAEEEAIAKALADGASLNGAALYTSLEPCSNRASKPESCCALILRHGIGKVVYALAEPPCLADCRSSALLRRNGVEVLRDETQANEVRLINAHILSEGGSK